MADLHDWWWLLATISASAFGCGLILFFTVLNFCGLDPCCSNINTSRKPMKAVQWLSTLSLLSFTICNLCQIFVILTVNHEGEVPDNVMQQMVQFTGLLSWTSGQLFIYLLFVANLHYSFKNTMHRLSKGSITFLCVSIISFCLCRVAYMSTYTLYYNSSITTQQAKILLAICVYSTEFVDLIVSIILVSLFIHRLFKLVSTIPRGIQQAHDPHTVQQRTKVKTNTNQLDVDLLANQKQKEHQKDVHSGAIEHSTVFYTQQETILYIASKYAILSFIAITSTQLFLVSAAINALSFKNETTEYYLASFSVYYGLLAMDCLINALCICLNLEYNDTWFWNCCCFCHSLCYCMCLRLSRKTYRSNN
eukprot:243246_1